MVGVRATPMKISPSEWTVFWETPQAYGAKGWPLTLAQAQILAIKIELGEVVV